MAQFFVLGNAIDSIDGSTPILEMSLGHVWVCPCKNTAGLSAKSCHWEFLPAAAEVQLMEKLPALRI